MKKKVVVGIILGIVVIPLIILALRADKDVNDNGTERASITGDGVGVIYVEGIITGGRDGGVLGSSVAGSEEIMSQLRLAAEDDRIKALVLRINSGGGSSAASEEIGYEIERVKAQGKIVVTSMGEVCASGGYWLASKSDKIVANSSTMTGSIGVIMPLKNLEELYGKIGVKDNAIKSGPYKDIGSEARTMTEEERQVLQGMVNEIYDDFVQVVAEGRNMGVDQVKKLADGRVYTGKQAKELGLVDEIGNFYRAVEVAKELANIEGKAQLIEYEQKTPLQELLDPFGQMGSMINKQAQFAELEKIFEGLKGVELRGVY